MNEGKDLQTMVCDIFDMMTELNGNVQSMNESIRNIPNAMMLKGMEFSIINESQKQHNGLASPEDLDRLERRIEALFGEVKAKLDHIEHDHLQPDSTSSAVELIKAVQEGVVQTKRLENERDDVREEHDLEEKKISSKTSRLKAWLKFWPLFAAALYELLKWAWPHIHSIVGKIGG